MQFALLSTVSALPKSGVVVCTVCMHNSTRNASHCLLIASLIVDSYGNIISHALHCVTNIIEPFLQFTCAIKLDISGWRSLSLALRLLQVHIELV